MVDGGVYRRDPLVTKKMKKEIRAILRRSEDAPQVQEQVVGDVDAKCVQLIASAILAERERCAALFDAMAIRHPRASAMRAQCRKYAKLIRKADQDRLNHSKAT